MKLWVMSDLHFEFHDDRGVKWLKDLPEPEYDAVAISGDLCDSRNLVHSLELVSDRFKDVYYVPGNHECYGSWINVTLATAKAMEKQLHNLRVLDCERDGIMAGATLWFPYTYREPLENEWCMNDFDEIRNLRKDVGYQNLRARDFLGSSGNLNVVMTHHLPGVSCVHPKYKHDALNDFYVGAVEDLLKFKKPKVWLHGHTHESMDHKVDETRVVCNPFGYMNKDVNPNFKPDLVIEV